MTRHLVELVKIDSRIKLACTNSTILLLEIVEEVQASIILENS